MHSTPDEQIAQGSKEFYKRACSLQNEEICQTLGKVLGYPWFKDDQINFPGATEENGVCVGEHIAETIAAEAADKIVKLRQLLQKAAERLACSPNDTILAEEIVDYLYPGGRNAN